MKRAVSEAFLFIVFSSATIQAASLQGSVFLMPIDTHFSSAGRADYLNDLNQSASAVLTGTHRVTGPSTFQSAVYGDGTYSYVLEGPAVPGACYGTMLTVIADPPGLNNTKKETWTGSGRCAPAADPTPPPGEDDQSDGCPPGGESGCGGSPIVLDLGGRTYRLTSLSEGVKFDLRNEGYRSQVGWTRADSEIAFLTLDRNGNGEVDHGGELFGNYTPLRSGALAANGFAALAELDDNEDATIDASDRAWTELLLWTDRNHDGYSTADEVHALADSSVVALKTAYRVTRKSDQWGNLFLYASEFYTRENGIAGRRTYYDVFFTGTP